MATFSGCILIDVRSAGAQLPRQLAIAAVLGRNDAMPFSLWVLDDTGDPRLGPIAQRFGARLLGVPSAPLGGRLNDGLARSNGQVLVFPGIGDNASAEALAHLASSIANGEFDAATLSTRRRAPLLQRLLALGGQHPHSGALCLARDWFDRIGGCDPELDEEALDELLARLHACGARVRSVAH